MRVAVLVALVAFSPGCFVLEELDKGKKTMDELSGAPDTQSETQPSGSADAAKPAADPEAWWKKARTLTPGETDPSIVRCDLDGSLQFMRRDDCIARGGRPGSS